MSSARPKVLWLHTQPEHYFNVMMDDLERGKGGGAYEFVAGFMYKGPGVYTQNAVPAVAKSIFLEARAGKGERPAGFFGAYHADWRRELKLSDYAAVIVSGYASRTAREVMRECHRLGIPVAMWTDSNIRSQRGKSFKARVKRRLKKRWLRGILRNLDYVITANSLGVAFWRYYGARRERIILCGYYSDYPRIDAARARERGEVLGKFGLGADAKVLFTAARLVPAKGLDTMVRAFMQGGFGARGWKWLIAGQGPLEGELKALAADAGDAIRFIGFQQPGDNLALTTHADLFVLPSRYEPHGIVISEALAGGTPVLASDVCGAAADLVAPGVSGETFRTDDVGDLTAKLHGLLDEAGKVAGMRAGARRAFEEWFARTSPIRVTNELVGRMISERARGGSARGAGALK